MYVIAGGALAGLGGAAISLGAPAALGRAYMREERG